MATKITAALALDNRQYLSSLNQATTATTNFSKKTVQAAQEAGNAFDRLKGIIAGLGFAKLTADAIRVAAGINNISAATGIAIDTVLGFQQAMTMSGGSAERASDALSDLTKNIGEAGNGSKELQAAFLKVGVTMDDMRKLSNEDIFKRVLQGLSEMPDKATRTATAFKLMGESVKGVDLNNLNKGLGDYTSQMAGNASAIKAAADAQSTMAANMQKLQIALVNVIEPLNKIASTLSISIGAFESVIKILAAVGVAYFSLGRGLKTVTSVMDGLSAGIKAGGGLFAVLGKQIGLALSGIKSFALGLGRAIGIVSGGTSAFFSLTAAVAGLLRFFLRFAGVAGIIYAIVEAVNALIKSFTGFDVVDTVIGKFKDLYYWGKKALGFGESGAGAGRGGNAETLKQQLEHAQKLRDEYEKQKAAQDKLNEAVANAAALNAVDMANRLDSMKRILTTQESMLIFENIMRKNAMETYALDEKELEIQKASYAIDFQRMNKMAEITREIEKLTVQYGLMKDKSTEEAIVLKGKLDDLGMEKNLVDKIYTRHMVGMTEQLRINQQLLDLEESRKKVREWEADQQEKALERQQKLNELTMSGQMQIDALKYEGTQIGIGDYEKQLKDIKERARLAAYEAGKAFSSQFDENMDADQAEELVKGLKEINAQYAEMVILQTANLEKSREWGTGMKEAIANYTEQAKNGAEQAKNYFETFTKGVEDAMVNFVQTGKLSFKDLANTLIAEFARIQAKKLLSGIMSGMGGGGGGGGFLSSLFGGFFADGGTLGAGKWGIAGENGPEIISGPATITPMQPMAQPVAQSTAITYNINAVDAASFKSMVARDPQFLYAVTEQGRRSMPGR